MGKTGFEFKLTLETPLEEGVKQIFDKTKQAMAALKPWQSPPPDSLVDKIAAATIATGKIAWLVLQAQGQLGRLSCFRAELESVEGGIVGRIKAIDNNNQALDYPQGGRKVQAEFRLEVVKGEDGVDKLEKPN